MLELQLGILFPFWIASACFHQRFHFFGINFKWIPPIGWKLSACFNFFSFPMCRSSRSIRYCSRRVWILNLAIILPIFHQFLNLSKAGYYFSLLNFYKIKQTTFNMSQSVKNLLFHTKIYLQQYNLFTTYTYKTQVQPTKEFLHVICTSQYSNQSLYFTLTLLMIDCFLRNQNTHCCQIIAERLSDG